MAQGLFGTAINCMDGRVQLPVNEHLKRNYRLDFIDTITEPGPVKILADKQAGISSIRQRVKISVEAHGSKLIAVVAHHDCAGNPVPKETQLKQLNSALETIQEWKYNVPCVGLWVDEKWQVIPIR
jgi:transcriptional regulator of met regulon